MGYVCNVPKARSGANASMRQGNDDVVSSHRRQQARYQASERGYTDDADERSRIDEPRAVALVTTDTSNMGDSEDTESTVGSAYTRARVPIAERLGSRAEGSVGEAGAAVTVGQLTLDAGRMEVWKGTRDTLVQLVKEYATVSLNKQRNAFHRGYKQVHDMLVSAGVETTGWEAENLSPGVPPDWWQDMWTQMMRMPDKHGRTIATAAVHRAYLAVVFGPWWAPGEAAAAGLHKQVWTRRALRWRCWKTTAGRRLRTPARHRR